MSFQRRSLSNDFPESGAIFMASKWTREECLERKLFGLPANYIDFVGRIKIGMLLFLFDFDSKELHGVFEASSDGGFNLVPDAYKSSKSKFPSQVHVNTLWQCAPLKEAALRIAIRENYFAENKFHFGLSTEQVCRLLVLFQKTKLSTQPSHMQEGYYQRPNKIATLLDESRSRASVLYTDKKEERLSVFKRLSCSSKVDKKEEHLSVFKRLSCSSKVIEPKSSRVNARTKHLGKNTNFEKNGDSLERLDTKHTVWHSHGEKASTNISVVSGLGNDVNMGAKNEQPENLSGIDVEICKDSKRKNTFLTDEQQKRKCLQKMKNCDELSDVPNFSQGSCKTETNVIVTDPSLTTPFICGGDEESVDDKSSLCTKCMHHICHLIQLRTGCVHDSVQMLLSQYKDYCSRSLMEDQSDIYGAHTCVIRR